MAFSFLPGLAQSTNIEFPTPVTSNVISGRIAARDIGDARLTTHYYYFNGNQGDIFIKISASNLDGDIDVFIADNLRPVTKISVFSDSPAETGREIYLRKPEKLILRVEGRTPGDAPATYSIKFEGSFLAVAAKKGATEEPKLPEIKSETEGTVKVNSVGTIIKTPPKPAPSKTTVAKTPVKTTSAPKPVSTVKEKPKSKDETDTSDENKSDKPEVTATEDVPKETASEKTVPKKTTTARTGNTRRRPATTAKKPTTTPPASTAKKPVKPPTAAVTEEKKPTPAEELAAALENIKLVVLFKDDRKVERPMNEVLRFTVDKGILTIISKDGKIARYSILEITKISVE